MQTGFNDPFAALLALQNALDSRLASDWMSGGTAGSGGYPPINVFQQGEDFVVIIELPGADKAALALEAKQNTIRISGRKAVAYHEGASIHRRERIFGVFDRTISLPVHIDPEAARAECRDGLLLLHIPRAAHEKPRTIKIK